MLSSMLSQMTGLPFLWLNNIPLCICTPHFLYPFVHWLDTQVVFIITWLLWIMLQWTWGLQISLWNSDFISFWYIAQSRIAGSFGNSIFIFWGTSTLFSIVVVSFYIPTTVQKYSLFSTPSPALVILCLFYHNGMQFFFLSYPVLTS